MINRAEIKSLARHYYKKNFWQLILIALIWHVIDYVVDLIPTTYGSLIDLVLISPASTLSILWIYLNQANGVKPSVARVFDGFSQFWKMLAVELLGVLLILFWSLFLIVPGIIKGISYSMAPYILAEDPDTPAHEAIICSAKMMDGHKMDYFLLYLSTIGWLVLNIVTKGIASVFIAPYLTAIYVNFYNTIKNESKSKKLKRRRTND